MGAESKKDEYRITIFKRGIGPKVKLRKIIFFTLGCLLVFAQSCYWLFANTTEPILVGMPFCMFFIVMFIVAQFFLLLILYFIESKEMED